MAKKKSAKVQAPKPKIKVETVFDCPFCNYAKCVEIKIDRDKRIGFLKCRICSTHFASKVHNLSAQVDVYCAWIDECHKINTLA